jgi:hypothetical protein
LFVLGELGLVDSAQRAGVTECLDLAAPAEGPVALAGRGRFEVDGTGAGLPEGGRSTEAVDPAVRGKSPVAGVTCLGGEGGRLGLGGRVGGGPVGVAGRWLAVVKGEVGEGAVPGAAPGRRPDAEAVFPPGVSPLITAVVAVVVVEMRPGPPQVCAAAR